MIVERRHVYKVFLDGQYLGMLQNVVSQFGYTQQINTPGTETNIDVSQSLDTASEPVEPLQDELGNSITTEDGQVITTERSTELIGVKGSGAIIASGNDVEIWEISDDHPNGVLVFSGYMSRWKGKIGSGDNISIKVISEGIDTDDYIIGDNAFVLEHASVYDGNAQFLARVGQVTPFGAYMFGQEYTFTPGFILSNHTLHLALGDVSQAIYPTVANITLNIYQGDPLGASTLVSSVTTAMTNVYPTFSDISMILPTPITIQDGVRYFFTVTADDYVMLGSRSSTTYPRMYSGNGTNLTSQFGVDMNIAFGLYSGDILTDANYTDQDPGDMVRSAMDNSYSPQGGVVVYTVSSIDDAGVLVSHQFKMATLLDVIKQARNYAGGNFYWYVDPATRVLYFKATATTATHRFIKGRHVGDTEVSSNIEGIVNVVYFTGGPTAGVNLLKKFTDTNSLARNRINMQKMSNNRVTGATQAQVLAENLMDEHSEEDFLMVLKVLASTYDIDSINPGDTVTVEGNGNFIDHLVLQITSLHRARNFVELIVGELPIRADMLTQKLKNDIDDVQTLDNPDVPS